MHRKSIYFVLALVLFLALFFQYNRQDGFLYWLQNTNSAEERPRVEKSIEVAAINEERWLVVYDPLDMDSLRIRLNVERVLRYMHKPFQAVAVQEAGEIGTATGVVLTNSKLDRYQALGQLEEYVRQGGSVYLLNSPLVQNEAGRWAALFGWKSLGERVLLEGVKVQEGLLFGETSLELSAELVGNYGLVEPLLPSVRVYMNDLRNHPLAWVCDFGRGRAVVFNGNMLVGKENRGVLAALLGKGQAVFAYPVLGAKLVYLDDFPAPVPEGRHEKIFSEYRLDMPSFFRQVWWPDMLKAAQRYHVKYTGMIVETYNRQVEAPFLPMQDRQTRTNLIVYGRELLRQGGELGIHGYNHQPLVEAAEQKHMAGIYEPWPSGQTMAAGLKEIRRYIGEAYPSYQVKVYVPPSNILGKKGREAIREVFPEMRTIASLNSASEDPTSADSYLQEFDQGPDGLLNMPRISADYVTTSYSYWVIANAASYLGLFAHFVHPDNIFYDENKDRTWKQMYDGYADLLKQIDEKYGWLRSCTASEGSELLADYLSLEYQMKQEPGRTVIFAWGFRQDAYFILRTRLMPRKVTGAQWQRLGNDAYLLRIQQPKVVVEWQEGGTP